MSGSNSNRPLFSNSIEELERWAGLHWDDVTELVVLQRELEHRKISSARRLAEAVNIRLTELRRRDATGARKEANNRGQQFQDTVEQLEIARAELEAAKKEIVSLTTKLRLAHLANDAPKEVDKLRRQLQDTASQMESVKAELETAKRTISSLTEELRAAQESNIDHGILEMYYARVGLDPRCPEFVFTAVRRAYRKQHHPDNFISKSTKERKAAEERFKEMEQIFDLIESERGWSNTYSQGA